MSTVSTVWGGGGIEVLQLTGSMRGLIWGLDLA